MAGGYDPLQGIETFQEYQGSLREEYIDGELRMFRTYIGESNKRYRFLIAMFGLVQVKATPTDIPYCTCLCAPLVPYPKPEIYCQVDSPAEIPNNNTILVPYGYRISPHDDQQASPLSTVTSLSVPPEIACLVLIEIEYRQFLQEWPDAIHDITFNGGTAEDPVPDVPNITAPRYFSYESDAGLQTHELENRQFGVASLGVIIPAVPAGPGGDAQLPPDDLHPVVNINTNEFKITVYNCPWIDYQGVDAHLGKVNDDVWFGYPTAAVLFAAYDIRERASVIGTIIYDIELTFMAKTVAANGELPGLVMPAAGNHVWPNTMMADPKSRVGVYNRTRWAYPITATTQYWWPIMDSEFAKFTSANPDTDLDKLPYLETDFHQLFAATTAPSCEDFVMVNC